MSNAFDKFTRLLKASVNNLSQSFYDSYVEANTRIRSRAGLKNYIIRRQIAKCCDWCANLTGVYENGKQPADIYKRHENCKCMVTFKSEKGTYTDVWSKKEFESQKEARIEKEKTIIKTNENSRKYFDVAKPNMGENAKYVNMEYINSQEYRMKYHGVSGDYNVDDKIYEGAKEILKERNGTENETLILFDEKGNRILEIHENKKLNAIYYSDEDIQKIEVAIKNNTKIIALHNHPNGFPPSADDAVSALHHGYVKGIAAGHNGIVYEYDPSPYNYSPEDLEEIDKIINSEYYEGEDIDKLWKKVLNIFDISYRRL